MTALSPEEYINACDADLTLLDLDAWEEVARRSESDPVTFMRGHHAAFYRQHFGFAPKMRQVVRAALEQLQQTGHASVQDVLAPFQAIGFSD